jgi:carbon storage regulator
MLVLSRKPNQSIMIGSNIRILVVGLDRDQVKLGIEAPRDVPIHRFEVFEEINRGNPSGARAGRGLRPPAGRDGDTKRAALNVDLGSLMDISERTLL